MARAPHSGSLVKRLFTATLLWGYLAVPAEADGLFYALLHLVVPPPCELKQVLTPFGAFACENISIVFPISCLIFTVLAAANFLVWKRRFPHDKCGNPLAAFYNDYGANEARCGPITCILFICFGVPNCTCPVDRYDCMTLERGPESVVDDPRAKSAGKKEVDVGNSTVAV